VIAVLVGCVREVDVGRGKEGERRGERRRERERAFKYRGSEASKTARQTLDSFTFRPTPIRKLRNGISW
jgi:hypothetical protein